MFDYDTIFTEPASSTLATDIIEPITKDLDEVWDRLVIINNDFREIIKQDEVYSRVGEIRGHEKVCLDRAFASILVDIRTLVDNNNNSYSLLNVLKKIHGHRHIFTLRRLKEKCKNKLFVDDMYSKYEGILDNCISENMIEAHKNELLKTASDSKYIVDKHIAHRDRNSAAKTIGFEGVDRVLEVAYKIFRTYYLVVTGNETPESLA